MKLSRADKKLIGESYEQMNAANNKPKYSLTFEGETYNVGDIMPECPFEGTYNALILEIEPNAEGAYDVDIFSDDEGYTVSTKDYPNITINKIGSGK